LIGNWNDGGTRFCRYADDCNIYVGSERAGARLMASLTEFLGERLKLKVNEAKSAVARPWQRKFLGYSMTWHQRPKLRIAGSSLTRLTEKLKALLRVGRGQRLATTIQSLNPVLRGWAAYFQLAETRRALEERDGWLRHKLRSVLWRQGKRRYRRARMMMQRGLTEARAWRSASNGRGPWWNAGASHMHAAFRSLGSTIWAGVAARHRATPPARFMNRRMRNRTYGGVGGRPGDPVPYRFSGSALVLSDRPRSASMELAGRGAA